MFGAETELAPYVGQADAGYFRCAAGPLLQFLFDEVQVVGIVLVLFAFPGKPFEDEFQ